MRDISDCLTETKGMCRELRKRGIYAVPCPVWVSVHELDEDGIWQLRVRCGFGQKHRCPDPRIYYGHLVTRLGNGLILDPRAYRFAQDPDIPGFHPPRWVRFTKHEFHIRVGNFKMSYFIIPDDREWTVIYKRVRPEVDRDALEKLLTPSPDDDPEITSRLTSRLKDRWLA